MCVPCRNFEHQRPVQFEGCVAEPPQTITAILRGSKWSCFLHRKLLQDAPSEVTQIYPPLKLRASVGDIRWKGSITEQVEKTTERDMDKAFERVNLPAVWAWAKHFGFPRIDFACAMWILGASARVQFEGCVAEPLQTITAILPDAPSHCALRRAERSG